MVSCLGASQPQFSSSIDLNLILGSLSSLEKGCSISAKRPHGF